MFIMSRSTSSVWGSAYSHERFDRRFMSDCSSVAESRISLNINSKSGSSALMAGSRDVICKTPAEHKANKLNRKEQTKLEHVTFRVVKEKEIAQRKFNQSERLLRAQSAKIVGRMKTLECSSKMTRRPMTYSYEKTMRGEQRLRQTSGGEERCEMCETIQKIISDYEEDSQTGSVEENSYHTTCLFSDVQVRAFVHMLETSYFDETPKLSKRLRDCGIATPKLTGNGSGAKLSREELSISIARRKVEIRIKQFCGELEKYNKTHSFIPKEVQESVERTRLQNAIVIARCHQEKHDRIKQEVQEMLGL